MGNNDRYRFHWLFLSCLSGYISVDEIASIHEKVGIMLGNFLHFHGFPCFAWIFPALFIVSVIGIMYVTFYFDLPMLIRRLFSFAVAVYLTGALGIELVAWKYLHADHEKTAIYALIATVEESMEFIGVIILAYALMVYVKNYIRNVSFELD